MKIRPNADFSAIPIIPAISPVKSDALAMQAESVGCPSVPERSDSCFVQDYPAKFFPILRKVVQYQTRKNRN